MEDIKSLLCLLNVIILGHITYRPFYEGQFVHFNKSHQELFSVAKTKAEGLLQYAERNLIVLKDNRQVELKQIFECFFVQQVRSLIKQRACYVMHGNAEGVTPKVLVETIAASFYRTKWFKRELKRQERIGYPAASFAWKSQEKFSISLRDVLGEGPLLLIYSRTHL